MPELEPTVTIRVEEYVVITYGTQRLVMPASEAPDLIKPLAKLLPDDLNTTK